jgi:hypothetical protein
MGILFLFIDLYVKSEIIVAYTTKSFQEKTGDYARFLSSLSNIERIIINYIICIMDLRNKK